MLKLVTNFTVVLLYIGIISTFLRTQNVSCTPYKQVQIGPTPIIKVSAYAQQDSWETKLVHHQPHEDVFVDDFIRKNGSDYVVQSDEIEELVISCYALYPVHWAFPNPDHLRTMSDFRLEISNIDTRIPNKFINPNSTTQSSKDIFITLLTLQPRSNFISINITCQATKYPKKQSSIYLYMSETSQFESEGHTLQVQLPKNRHQDFVIPCRPSLPDTIVDLYVQRVSSRHKVKSSERKIQWSLVNTRNNKYVKFDPKVGFTFVHRWPSFIRSIPTDEGMYKCVINNGDDVDEDFAMVNVTSAPTVTTAKNTNYEPLYNLRRNAHVKIVNKTKQNGVSYTYTSFVFVCCTGVQSKPPNVQIISCNSAMTCNLKKMFAKENQVDLLGSRNYLGRFSTEKEFGDDCTLKYFHGGVQIATCQGDNVDFAQEYISIFKKVQNPEPNSAEKKVPYQNNSLTYEYVPYNRDIALEEKLAILVFELKPKSRFKIYQNQGYNFNSYYGRALISTIVTNAFEAVSPKKLDLAKRQIRRHLVPHTTVYAGETVIFACFSAKYFYSRGAYLTINWKNNTKSFLGGGSRLFAYYILTKVIMPSAGMTNFEFTTPLKAEMNMDSVECFAPVSESTDWDKITNHLNILESVKPKFEGNQNEIVYWTINQSDQQISCEVVEGIPTPSLRMTKDGKAITSMTRNSTNTNDFMKLGNYSFTTNGTFSQILTFSIVTHEVHGEYRCIAKNVNGTAMKIIKVIIIEKSNNKMMILTSCLGVLSAVLVTLTILFLWLQRKKRELTGSYSRYN